MLLTVEKTTIKKKEAGNGPFLNWRNEEIEREVSKGRERRIETETGREGERIER